MEASENESEVNTLVRLAPSTKGHRPKIVTDCVIGATPLKAMRPRVFLEYRVRICAGRRSGPRVAD